MFSKILIANRGEIAVRVIRACKEMGISTVAVYSKADESSLHVALADQGVCIGEAPASESYLNGGRIVSAAMVTKAQAIHPGYGFLSENAGFVQLCESAGIAFIGPPAGVIAKMGDKDEARRIMGEAGVPVIPGTGVLPDAAAAVEAAADIGYPIMIKARSGGGGRGIRAVGGPGEMERAFAAASREAEEAFGDGALYIEKRIYPARHIEVQLLCDEAGTALCLYERECSAQKNNQKTLEESPSPAVTQETRDLLCGAAVAAARAAGYRNAGTVEFLLDGDGNFYFMEMNVRLQVEHAVTEQVTGIDIVKWQIRVAAGVPLTFKQENIALSGHSIECRINAVSPGSVTFLHVPGGPKVRFDSALWTGCTITPYYDPLLGKVIVHAGTREEAIRKMYAALCELVIEGIPNDIDDRIVTLTDPDFKRGTYFV
ncbi:MAG: ATP-grasp domain-containing protein [Oscillospiraceae bacterium]|jgi:acetyl-CoA carboxylase biotin carboxylase subunit|nr:ATP-grasp domain-containing protein [Oscillospiraceae bacterium]